MRVTARTLRLAAVVGAATCLIGAASGSSRPASSADHSARRVAPERPIAARPTAARAWIARIVVPVHPRSAPRAAASRMPLLTGAAPYNGNPEALLVMGATSTRREGVWYRVLLNSRPNTATGWVPAAAVHVSATPYRVLVNLSTRRATLLRANRVVVGWPVAVGTRGNPTPVGRFAVSEIVRQPGVGGFFGPYILSLTAHSERLSDFDGGDGRIALHGTNRPHLIGRAVSHGCVRFANPAITRLARTVPPGTPVDIVA